MMSKNRLAPFSKSLTRAFCSFLIFLKRSTYHVNVFMNVIPYFTLIQHICLSYYIGLTQFWPNKHDIAKAEFILGLPVRMLPIGYPYKIKRTALTVATVLQVCSALFILFRFLSTKTAWDTTAKSTDVFILISAAFSNIFLPISISILVSNFVNYNTFNAPYYFAISVIFFMTSLLMSFFLRRIRDMSIDFLPLPEIEWAKDKYPPEIPIVIVAAIVASMNHIDNSTWRFISISMIGIFYLIVALKTFKTQPFISTSYTCFFISAYLICFISSVVYLVSLITPIDFSTIFTIDTIFLLFLPVIVNHFSTQLQYRYTKKLVDCETEDEAIALSWNETIYISMVCRNMNNFMDKEHYFNVLIEHYNSYDAALVYSKLGVIFKRNIMVDRGIDEMRRRSSMETTRQCVQIALFEMIRNDNATKTEYSTLYEDAIRIESNKFFQVFTAFWTEVLIGNSNKLVSIASNVAKKYDTSMNIIFHLHKGWEKNEEFSQIITKIRASTDNLSEERTVHRLRDVLLTQAKRTEEESEKVIKTEYSDPKLALEVIEESTSMKMKILNYIISYSPFYVFLIFIIVMLSTGMISTSNSFKEVEVLYRISNISTLVSRLFFSQSLILYGHDCNNSSCDSNAMTDDIFDNIMPLISAIEESLFDQPVTDYHTTCTENNNTKVLHNLSLSSTLMFLVSDFRQHKFNTSNFVEIYEYTNQLLHEIFFQIEEKIKNLPTELALQRKTKRTHMIGVLGSVHLALIIILVIMEKYEIYYYRSLFRNFLEIPKPLVAEQISMLSNSEALGDIVESFDQAQVYRIKQLLQGISPMHYFTDNQRCLLVFIHSLLISTVTIFFGYFALKLSDNILVSSYNSLYESSQLLQIPSTLYQLGTCFSLAVHNRTEISLELFENATQSINSLLNKIGETRRNESILKDYIYIFRNNRWFSVKNGIVAIEAIMNAVIQLNGDHENIIPTEELAYVYLFMVNNYLNRNLIMDMNNAYEGRDESNLVSVCATLSIECVVIWLLFISTLITMPSLTPEPKFARVVLSAGIKLFLKDTQKFIAMISKTSPFKKKETPKLGRTIVDGLMEMVLLLNRNSQVVYSNYYTETRIRVKKNEDFEVFFERVTGQRLPVSPPKSGTIKFPVAFKKGSFQRYFLFYIIQLNFVIDGIEVRHAVIIRDETNSYSTQKRENREAKMLNLITEQFVPRSINEATNNLIIPRIIGTFIIENQAEYTPYYYKEIQKQVAARRGLVFFGRSISSFRVVSNPYQNDSMADSAIEIIRFANEIISFTKENRGIIRALISVSKYTDADIIENVFPIYDVFSPIYSIMYELATVIEPNQVTITSFVFDVIYNCGVVVVFIGEKRVHNYNIRLYSVEDIKNIMQSGFETTPSYEVLVI